MNIKMQGKIKSIYHSQHSESLWKILLPLSSKIIYCTDLADTPADYKKWTGKNVIFEALIQLAHLSFEHQGLPDKIFFPNKNCYVEFIGVIREAFTAEEFVVDIDGDLFNIMTEENYNFKVGNRITGKGEMRISVPTVTLQNIKRGAWHCFRKYMLLYR